MAEEGKSGGSDNQEESAVQKKDDGASKNAAASVNPKIVYIALLINVLALLAVAFFVYKKNSERSAEPTIGDIKKESDHAAQESSEDHAEAKPEGGEHKEGEGKGEKAGAEDNYIKESFTVNLADADTQHFALVDVAIEVSNSFVKTEIEKNRPKIRDFIVILLSSKTLDEVSNPDGREFLREEIRTKIDGFLTKGEIKTVLFEKFIIQ